MEGGGGEDGGRREGEEGGRVEGEGRRKMLKDENKSHGAVDESLSEQQFHESNTTISFLV